MATCSDNNEVDLASFNFDNMNGAVSLVLNLGIMVQTAQISKIEVFLE